MASQVAYLEVKKAKLRLDAAKTQESSALKIVQSQKVMLEMIQRNMANAQSHLEECGQKTKEAAMNLKEAEEKMEKFLKIEKANVSVTGEMGDDVALKAGSVEQKELDRAPVSNHNAVEDSRYVSHDERSDVDSRCTSNEEESYGAAKISSRTKSSPPCLPQARTQEVLASRSTRSPASWPKADPHIISKLRNLSPKCKMILREIVLSGILHPKGEVDPDMLSKLTSKEVGLPKRDILNAVALARMRHRSRNKEARMRSTNSRCA